MKHRFKRVLHFFKKANKMIYYCVYKNECPYKDCAYRQTESKFSNSNTGQDLTINEFTCNLTDKRRTRLISDERIICDRYRSCRIKCIFKTSYITINNFEEYFGNKFDSSKLFKCYDVGNKVRLITAGKNTGSYTSIWDQPNLFIKRRAI